MKQLHIDNPFARRGLVRCGVKPVKQIIYTVSLSILVLLVQPFAWTHEEIDENAGPSTSVGEMEQDHSPDEAENEQEPQTPLSRLVDYAGKWHVVVVHYPIALIISAFLAELLFVVTARPLFRDAARFTLIAGAISVVAVVPLGWAAAAFGSFSGEETTVLFFHRWVGTGAGIAALTAAAASELAAHHRAEKWSRPVYRALLVLSAAAVGVAGHLGGMLVHGLDFLSW